MLHIQRARSVETNHFIILADTLSEIQRWTNLAPIPLVSNQMSDGIYMSNLPSRASCSK